MYFKWVCFISVEDVVAYFVFRIAYLGSITEYVIRNTDNFSTRLKHTHLFFAC